MIRALVFDWGDTVMRVFPEYQGPTPALRAGARVAEWPRVEAVPGVEEALRAVRPRYRLALATNAAASGAALVRAALRRVGLDEYFEVVVTARELGASKPEPAFFQAVLRQLGCAPYETAMIGDSYQADVVGAKEANWRAVWFNPDASPCPLVHPMHDAEAKTMAELSTVTQNLLPDVAECMALLVEQDLQPHALQHCRAVAAVAFRLATLLRERGETVNPLLAHRGGLLHDLDKVTSKRLEQTHGQVAAQILLEKGYPELASIAQRHLTYLILDPASRPATWEEKSVFYADKIVNDDQVVGLRERIANLYRRYPERADRIRQSLSCILELEAEICGRLGVTPVELLATLKSE